MHNQSYINSPFDVYHYWLNLCCRLSERNQQNLHVALVRCITAVGIATDWQAKWTRFSACDPISMRTEKSVKLNYSINYYKLLMSNGCRKLSLHPLNLMFTFVKYRWLVLVHKAIHLACSCRWQNIAHFFTT